MPLLAVVVPFPNSPNCCGGCVVSVCGFDMSPFGALAWIKRKGKLEGDKRLERSHRLFFVFFSFTSSREEVGRCSRAHSINPEDVESKNTWREHITLANLFYITASDPTNCLRFDLY